MAWSWRRELPMLAVIVGMLVASWVVWGRVGDEIPMHWNARGEIDRYGGKVEGLLLLPAITLGLWALLVGIPYADPARKNYESFAGSYALIRGVLVAFMAAIHGFVIATALGHEIPIYSVLPPALGVMFILLGNAMGKFRPNFFAGARTPWTLASVKSWDATHRVAGRVFIAGGVGFLLTAVIREPWFLFAVLGLFLVGAAWTVFYSWQVYRDDPDRVSVFDVRPADE